MKRNVQSLSVCVPGKKCINRCEFCVACMHTSFYRNQMDENLPFYDLYFEDYVKRMCFAKENDANIMMITGDIEPLQNRHFLQTLAHINNDVLPARGCGSFYWIELQTSGVLFDRNYARFLRNTVGVSVLSLSIASFDDAVNSKIQNMMPKNSIVIRDVCNIAKEYDFTLRISVNMSQFLMNSAGGSVEQIFNIVKSLGADQLTFRKLYAEGDNPQSRWIERHNVSDEVFKEIDDYVIKNGKHLGILPYGYHQYSVDGISVVIDVDCMNQQRTEKQTSKYFVLRPDCKLYDGWLQEDKIF